MTSGFFSLFDDIAALMDDVAVMSKVAAKKTAGILGDDLAVNAEKASGFVSSRELPVLWAIAKGSAINKVIILPIAFLLSAFMPWIIVPILLIGGIYLAYEGAEKIYEYFVPHSHQRPKTTLEVMSKEQILAHEKEKIKSAIFTDFILSAEIIILALGTVVESTLTVQIVVVSFVAMLATVGVYGIVALIIRMDDFGYKLLDSSKDEKSIVAKIGKILIASLPKVIKSLTVIGTVAMLLVAGGIYVHNIDKLHGLIHSIPSIVGELGVGLVVGFIALFSVELFKKVRKLQ